MAGMGPKDSAREVSSAAPVGVTSSTSSSLPTTGTPSSRARVAGAGSGMRPWAPRTNPRPSGRGDAYTRSIPNSANPARVPMTSTIVSAPPSSCRWTSSSVVPWMPASTSPSLRKTAMAFSWIAGARALWRTISSMSDRCRAGTSSATTTSTLVAPNPPLSTRSQRSRASARPSASSTSSRLSSGIPASTSAPRIMSPLIPATQSK